MTSGAQQAIERAELGGTSAKRSGGHRVRAIECAGMAGVPQELAQQVFALVPPFARGTAASTCRSWRALLIMTAGGAIRPASGHAIWAGALAFGREELLEWLWVQQVGRGGGRAGGEGTGGREGAGGEGCGKRGGGEG